MRNHAQQWLGAGVVAVLAGCQGAPPVDGAPGVGQSAISTLNGLSINGLSINGLSINGLSINGLSINGLSINGLSASTFSTWFNENLASTPTLMSYIVKCALPTTGSLSWTNPSTGVAYTWTGNLGLAPTWASGAAPTTIEQQLITACLAAHANKYGLHVSLAVEGRDSSGVEIPMAAEEMTTYAVREGCFFGNLFTGDAIFAGYGDTAFDAAMSSPRACAMEPATTMSGCAPIMNVGSCQSLCQSDPTGTYYTSCTYQGKTYQPLTTRILPSDVYTCGDGVCQFTESCGTAGLNVASSCTSDCGECPTT